jgi:superfamily I DNA and RNA helicase
MEASLKQLSRDLELMRVQSTSLSERIGDLEKQSADNVMDPAHLARLEKQVAAFDKEQKKAASSAGGVQEQVNR